jgi:hypothetical protein
MDELALNWWERKAETQVHAKGKVDKDCDLGCWFL